MRPNADSRLPPIKVKLDLARENALVYVLNSEPFGMWREASVPPLFDPTETINANLTIAYQSGDVVDIIMVAAVGQYVMITCAFILLT